MGKELLNRNKMASIDDRQKQVEDKKQELLRRIAEKKKIRPKKKLFLHIRQKYYRSLFGA